MPEEQNPTSHNRSFGEADYATVDQLAVLTHEQLDARARRSPGVETLTALFRIMYAASMATEEGQSITFELTWIDPENSDPNRPERVVPDRWTTVPFASSIPLGRRALVKAAKSTDPRTSAFAIYGTGKESLFIWGLIDQGNGPYDFVRFDSRSGQDRPGVFQASAVGVGHLAVSIEYEPIAGLRIDRLSPGGLDVLRSGPILEALQPGLNDYVQAVRAEISSEIYEDRSHWDITLKRQWLAAVARVLLRIRDMRHGGALLIAQEDLKMGSDIKYEIEYPRPRDALRQWGINTITETHASDLIGEALDVDEPAIDADHYLTESVAREDRKDVESEIDGTLWFIACLSRVDGLAF